MDGWDVFIELLSIFRISNIPDMQKQQTTHTEHNPPPNMQRKPTLTIKTLLVKGTLHFELNLHHHHPSGQTHPHPQQVKQENEGKQSESELVREIDEHAPQQIKQQKFYGFIQEEVFNGRKVLKQWFQSLKEFSQYIDNVANLEVDSKRTSLSVMVRPFQGKTKSLQICRLRLYDFQADNPLIQSYLSIISNIEPNKSPQKTPNINEMYEKLVKLYQNLIQQNNQRQEQRQRQKNILLEKLSNIEQKLSQIGQGEKTVVITPTKKQKSPVTIKKKQFKQPDYTSQDSTKKQTVKIKMEKGVKKDKYAIFQADTKRENFKSQTQESEDLMPKGKPDGRLRWVRHAKLRPQDKVDWKVRPQEPEDKPNKRYLYHIKRILQGKDNEQQKIPPYIDKESSYLSCFDFKDHKITLKRRPIQSDYRPIMLLTNIVLTRQVTIHRFSIKILKHSPQCSISIGIVNLRHRRKKFCKSRDGVIKMNSKGYVMDGKECKKEVVLFLHDGDVIIMRVAMELGIIEWLKLVAGREEHLTSCTNMSIQSTKIDWVPFIEMKAVGDSVEWLT